MLLADRIKQAAQVATNTDDVIAYRRGVCLGTNGNFERCPEVIEEGNILRCGLCNCGDPTRNRPKCPVNKWGLEQTVLVLTRPKNWQKTQDKVATALTENRWNVASTPFKTEQVDQGLSDWIAANSVKPRATVSWEEHGILFIRRSTIAYAQACIEKGIAPLHIDFSNLNHGQAYVLDYYNPETHRGLIEDQWGYVSDDRIDWHNYDVILKGYIDNITGKLDQVTIGKKDQAVLWTQWSTALSNIRGSWQEIAERIAEQIKPMKLVVKAGPIGFAGMETWDSDIELIRHNPTDPLQNAKLIKESQIHFIISSSVSNEMILANAPVISIGRGRHCGKNVFMEIKSTGQIHDSVTSPIINQKARNKWLRWWAENTYYPDQLGRGLDRMTHYVLDQQVREITTVTPVYINDERSETITRQCLQAVRREFPNNKRIVAVDKAPDAFVEEVRGMGFIVIQTTCGTPPRLMPLYHLANQHTLNKYLLTVESDVILPKGFCKELGLSLSVFDDPNVVCVEAITVNEQDKINYPSKDRIPNFLKPYSDDHDEDTRHPTFSGVLWRTDILNTLSWGGCAPFLYGDKDLWRLLKAQSKDYKALIAKNLKVLHYGKVARSSQSQASQSQASQSQAFEHRYYYSGVWKRHTTWLGRIVQKCPNDLWMYQQIIVNNRPDIIIETGTLFSGASLYLANICDLVGNGRVITVDLVHRTRLDHPRLTYITGSSISDDVHTSVREIINPDDKVMVILDSDHTKNHVANEIKLFSPYVSPGQYLIVEDCNLNTKDVRHDFGPGPHEAVQDFLRSAEGKQFVVDKSCEQFLHTQNRDGYLRRLEGGANGTMSNSR